MPKTTHDSNLERTVKIGSTMASQDLHGLQRPLFVIMIDRKQYVTAADDWEQRERVDPDLLDEKGLCTDCIAHREQHGQLPDNCDQCHVDTWEYYRVIREVDLRSGVYFTSEACKAHIEANSYHYVNPQVVAIPTWRNPEMATVMEHLIRIGGNEVPSDYQYA